MYLSSYEKHRKHKRISKCGKEFFKKSTKTFYKLQCDKCGIIFHREKGEFDPKRACNEYKHFCSKCFSFSDMGRYGTENQIKALEDRIGTKKVDAEGYVSVYVGPDSSDKQIKSSGIYGGGVREHILVMETHLGRLLEKGEVVHHIDGNKTNNNIENLDLCTVQQHNKCHAASKMLIFELYKRDIVGYDRKNKMYYLR